MRRHIEYFFAFARIVILSQIQYRVANYFYMIGMITEPVIYLVVWSTIAEQQGGEVGGYTAGMFAAYYIVWTLVRNMNIVFTPFGWENRIREGELSMELMRPIHPIFSDIAGFSGWKVVVIILWLPLAVFLTWVFKPTLDFTWPEGRNGLEVWSSPLEARPGALSGLSVVKSGSDQPGGPRRSRECGL